MEMGSSGVSSGSLDLSRDGERGLVVLGATDLLIDLGGVFFFVGPFPFDYVSFALEPLPPK
jgi:hypothetical protein